MSHYIRIRRRQLHAKVEWTESALKLADEKGLSEEQRRQIRGSGKGGRVILRDVQTL